MKRKAKAPPVAFSFLTRGLIEILKGTHDIMVYTYSFSSTADEVGYRSSLRRLRTVLLLDKYIVNQMYDNRTKKQAKNEEKTLFWKSMDVPIAHCPDIPDRNLQGVKVERRNGIEGNIEQNQGPLEKGVRRVS